MSYPSKTEFDNLRNSLPLTYQTRGNYAFRTDLASNINTALRNVNTALAAYAKKTDIPVVPANVATKTDLAGYALASDLSKYQPAGRYVSPSELEAYQAKGDYALAKDLVSYAKSSDLANFQPKGEYALAADLASYAKSSDLANFQPKGEYALAANLASYAKSSDLVNFQPKGEYALAADLASYAKESSLASYQPKGDYAVKSDLASYQPKGDYALAADLASYARQSSLASYQPKGDYALAKDLESYAVKTDLAGYQPKGNYQTAGNYALQTDLDGYQPKGSYALQTDLAGYQPKGNYQTAGNYALKTELANYALTKDFANLQPKGNYQTAGNYALQPTAGNYALQSELAGYVKTAGASTFSGQATFDKNAIVKTEGTTPFQVLGTGGLRVSGGNLTVNGTGAGTNGSVLISGNDAYGHAFYVASSSAAGKRLGLGNTGTVGNVFAYDYASNVPQNLTLQGPGGNVGIGTDSPSAKLHVNGSAIFNAASAEADVGISWKRSTNNTDWFMYNPTGSDQLRIYNGGDRVTFTSSGNVGIGTTSPSYKLDVSGNGRFTGNLDVGGGVAITSDTIKTTSGPLHISGEGLLYLLNKNGVVVGKDWGGNGNLSVGNTLTIGGNLRLDSSTGNTSFWPGHALLMDSAGIPGGSFIVKSDAIKGNTKVGINNESPTHSLDVSGNGRFTKNLNVEGNLSTGNATITTLTVGNFNMTGAPTFSALATFKKNATVETKADTPFQVIGPGGLLVTGGNFTVTGNSTFGGNSIFTSSGNVGIGTTSPSSSYNLDVSGNGRFTGNLDVTTAGNLSAANASITNLTVGKQYANEIETNNWNIKSDGSTLVFKNRTNPITQTWLAGRGENEVVQAKLNNDGILYNAGVDTTGVYKGANSITTGNLKVNVQVSAANADITNLTVGNFNLTGAPTFGALATFKSNAIVETIADIPFKVTGPGGLRVTGGNFTVTGDSAFSGNSTFNGVSTFSGVSTFANDLKVTTGGNLSAANANITTLTVGNMQVTGAPTFGALATFKNNATVETTDSIPFKVTGAGGLQVDHTKLKLGNATFHAHPTDTWVRMSADNGTTYNYGLAAKNLWTNGDLSVGGNASIKGILEANSLGLNPSDSFIYGNNTLGNYGLKWANETGNKHGPTAFLSSYGGIKMFTQGGEKVAIDVDGNTTIKGGLAANHLFLETSGDPALRLGPNIKDIGNARLNVQDKAGNYMKFFRGGDEMGSITHTTANGTEVNVGKINVNSARFNGTGLTSFFPGHTLAMDSAGVVGGSFIVKSDATQGNTKVGINTSNPTSSLHVVGNTLINGSLDLNFKAISGGLNLTNGEIGSGGVYMANNNGHYTTDTNGGDMIIRNNKGTLRFVHGGGSSAMTINSNNAVTVNGTLNAPNGIRIGRWFIGPSGTDLIIRDVDQYTPWVEGRGGIDATYYIKATDWMPITRGRDNATAKF